MQNKSVAGIEDLGFPPGARHWYGTVYQFGTGWSAAYLDRERLS